MERSLSIAPRFRQAHSRRQTFFSIIDALLSVSYYCTACRLRQATPSPHIQAYWDRHWALGSGIEGRDSKIVFRVCVCGPRFKTKRQTQAYLPQVLAESTSTALALVPQPAKEHQPGACTCSQTVARLRAKCFFCSQPKALAQNRQILCSALDQIRTCPSTRRWSSPATASRSGTWQTSSRAGWTWTCRRRALVRPRVQASS